MRLNRQGSMPVFLSRPASTSSNQANKTGGSTPACPFGLSGRLEGARLRLCRGRAVSVLRLRLVEQVYFGEAGIPWVNTFLQAARKWRLRAFAGRRLGFGGLSSAIDAPVERHSTPRVWTGFVEVLFQLHQGAFSRCPPALCVVQKFWKYCVSSSDVW